MAVAVAPDGKAMRSKRFIELGVARSYSRPHVSNDNPHSEAQFKTLKYHGTFPERFVRGKPSPRQVHEGVWINNPRDSKRPG